MLADDLQEARVRLLVRVMSDARHHVIHNVGKSLRERRRAAYKFNILGAHDDRRRTSDFGKTLGDRDLLHHLNT
jgi:hypothetical protein